jgi:integrase
VARDYGADSAGPLDEVPGVASKSVRQAHGALLERVRAAVRLRGYAMKTEQSYLHWIMRFIGYLGNADPSAKGAKDRAVPLPEKAVEPLREYLARVRDLHQADLAQGFGEVYLPDALARKYPKAAKEWRWQYVFPSGRVSADPRSGAIRRHHLHENGLQKAVKLAAEHAAITKRVGTHTLWHYASPLICCNPVMTSERCRNFWVTPTCPSP